VVREFGLPVDPQRFTPLTTSSFPWQPLTSSYFKRSFRAPMVTALRVALKFWLPVRAQCPSLVRLSVRS